MINVFGVEETGKNIRKLLKKSQKKWNQTLQAMKMMSVNKSKIILSKQIRKSSKFSSYFKDIHEVQISRFCEKKDNLTTFYCPALLNILLEKYLPLFPLFSLFVVPNLTLRDLPSSSSI
jgi:hypothetical protein